MKALTVIGMASLLSFYAYGHECQPPKRLTCEQLIAKAEQRGCLENLCPLDYDGPECKVECPPCEPTVVRDTQFLPGPIEYVDSPMPRPVAEGHALVGLGALYLHGFGLQAFGGYQWRSGWQVQAGPMWVPQGGVDAIHGVATRGCIRIPFVVDGKPAKHPWGVGASVAYLF